jgi:hypothetical protein
VVAIVIARFLSLRPADAPVAGTGVAVRAGGGAP